jgi:hypothetical protein
LVPSLVVCLRLCIASAELCQSLLCPCQILTTLTFTLYNFDLVILSTHIDHSSFMELLYPWLDNHNHLYLATDVFICSVGLKGVSSPFITRLLSLSALLALSKVYQESGVTTPLLSLLVCCLSNRGNGSFTLT